MSFKRIAVSLLVALPLLGSCRTDDSLNEPDVIDPMFRRYVSLGNSITAGFQSLGINDSTQVRSYANLLAMAMGTDFNMPLFNDHPQLGKGCPAPVDTNSTDPPGRVGPPQPTGCSLRVPTNGLINNVAFPGAEVAELLDNFADTPSATDAYKQFILGGRTEVELMRVLDPTFVSVFIGANDVLGALLDYPSATNPNGNAGNPAAVTPVGTFTASYDEMLDEVEAVGARAVLVSVPDVTVIPFASRSAIYYCLTVTDALRCQAPLPTAPDPNLAGLKALGRFDVNVNCAAPGGLATLVPWPIGLQKIATAAAGGTTVIDCSLDNEVVTPTEYQGMVDAVAGYNAHIASEAAARGFAYFDINPGLAAAIDNVRIRPFPDLLPALAGGNVGFGTFFSLDGFHPSSLAHQAIADGIADAINTHYSTTLPVPICGTVTCPAP